MTVIPKLKTEFDEGVHENICADGSKSMIGTTFRIVWIYFGGEANHKHLP